ncbi:hypothetical protein GYMLUDRAFT_819691 [Collybiopsis luxurians FD-317 M1]|uniref:Uncharacterized protein n=1 Tax=Collybiopsis luxurians FD-317 M1 TaxID=944289 RepID=A0A0D0BN77_9AGAR|nr:hypothetical protein GYMLUDRAFT_819691 [Collybiopsis luxurians FD-317 M1]
MAVCFSLLVHWMAVRTDVYLLLLTVVTSLQIFLSLEQYILAPGIHSSWFCFRLKYGSPCDSWYSLAGPEGLRVLNVPRWNIQVTRYFPCFRTISVGSENNLYAVTEPRRNQDHADSSVSMCVHLPLILTSGLPSAQTTAPVLYHSVSLCLRLVGSSILPVFFPQASSPLLESGRVLSCKLNLLVKNFILALCRRFGGCLGYSFSSGIRAWYCKPEKLRLEAVSWSEP